MQHEEPRIAQVIVRGNKIPLSRDRDANRVFQKPGKKTEIPVKYMEIVAEGGHSHIKTSECLRREALISLTRGFNFPDSGD